MVQERELVDALVSRLRSRLPPRWDVREEQAALKFDAGLEIRSPRGKPRFLMVATKAHAYPQQVRDWLARLRQWSAQAKRRADANEEEILVAAPFLGPEARRLLTEHGIGYFDLTGNLRVHLAEPALFIEEKGADRNPDPEPGLVRTLSGAKALAVVRVLCDFVPPLTVTQIARLATTTPAYVSKLLTKLQREGLIERSPREPVQSVDWRRLIEARARDFDLLESSVWRGFVPTTGRPRLFEALIREAERGRRLALTGPTAAERIAPTAQSRWMCYTDDIRSLSESLSGFLRSSSVVEGHMILLEPVDPVVFERMVQGDGPPCVAHSQAAIDCLSGPDRAPEQGLALLDWMERRVDEWRHPITSSST